MSKGRLVRVLFAASECAPWVKTGGLGDVVSALPPALVAQGIDVRLCLPLYGSLRSLLGDAPVCGQVLGALIREAVCPSGVPVYLVDDPRLFDRPGGPYQGSDGKDWPDNALRFGVFSRIVATLASAATALAWKPDVLHIHDWQTGLAPVWLKTGLPKPASVVATIHNLAFQGVFSADWREALSLPAEVFAIEGVEFYGQLSFLKGALQYADKVTTVSPTYAREIQGAAYGCGLEGLLTRRRDDLVGIVNGIDEVAWNPAADALIPAAFSAQDLSGKALNKAALQRRFGLKVQKQRPLFGLVGRLTWQKGVDLVVAVARDLVAAGSQLVVLGSGEPALEAAVLALAAQYPGAIGVHIGFDEGRAHLLEAGSDVFLMPSRFEPCGLNQMYSQRYGTLPIARATGGLVDTITDARSGESAEATGLLFEDATPEGLWEAMAWAQTAYRNHDLWARLQRQGMRRDFSWQASATRYREVYEQCMRASDKKKAPARG